MASITIVSHDIQSLRPFDHIDEYYIPKEKIVFGEDGVAIDVSYDTPFPVLGNFQPQSFSNFGSGTPTQISVSDVSTILLNSNTNRKYGLIINNSDQRIYLQMGNADAVYKVGIPLSPNSMWEINSNGLFIGQISAITNIGLSVMIDVIEGV